MGTGNIARVPAARSPPTCRLALSTVKPVEQAKQGRGNPCLSSDTSPSRPAGVWGNMANTACAVRSAPVYPNLKHLKAAAVYRMQYIGALASRVSG